MASLEDKIKQFLSLGSGYGCGEGSGNGGYFGNGEGEGYGEGSGSGSLNGEGEGYGFGDGYGCGDGSGYGCGHRYDDGLGFAKLKSYNHRKVYYIDYIPTLIDSVRGNVARGYMINSDMTISACYVAKVGNSFAHGDTIHAAHADASAKHMRGMSEEERIDMFVSEHPNLDGEYPCEDLFKWHNTLTGSCEMGRTKFCRDHGISLSEKYTIRYFLDITKNAYGGSVIKKVQERYE